MPLFSKILIANRGEIACRVIKTAKKMGIPTVAVYSDADSNSLHVAMADEAVHIGGSASSESYLKIDTIIEACKNTGAEAVHPGFGFLSENAAFATALEKAGIVFIGPGKRAIEVMGDKIESKKLAESSGVNTVPGHTEALDDAKRAFEIASDIGCPVMLKASAGGGGKGMRIAWSIDEVKDGFTSAQNEARSAFGDDRVFVEKYIERPRHIEIQVLADTYGNCIALGERECSIQRRHQKVLEEAPSPFIDEKTRTAMQDQAVALAKTVDYCSAGTVEFIVDNQSNFYFLEMNTRLQVEHPVTEFITGLDLVEQMIRVAAGEKLSMQQSDVELKGWSLEARVYAEDPDRNFMPSIGRLSHYQPPAEGDIALADGSRATVRVDTGVFEGGEISMYYDPMIAKLVTHADTRAGAITAMSEALEKYVVRGVNHNIPFLNALITHPSFKSGDLTTGFIDEHYPDGFDSSQVSDASSLASEASAGLPAIVLPAVFAEHKDRMRARGIDNQLRRSTHQSHAPNSGQINDSYTYAVVSAGSTYSVEVSDAATNEQAINITHGAQTVTLSTQWLPGQYLFESQLANDAAGKPKTDLTAQISRNTSGWSVSHSGQITNVYVMSPRSADMLERMPEKQPPDLSRFLLSPMPGLLLKLSVSEGENVKAGQELAVVEAMKMENVLTAAQDGVVKAIPETVGASLSVDQVIIEFE